MPKLRRDKVDQKAALEQPREDGPKVLFDRGILSRWFILYRLIEEIDRASRYQRPLTVLVARPQLLPDDGLPAEARAAAADAATRTARSTDLVGWLSDDSILIMMPETVERAAQAAVNRWKNEIWLRSRASGAQKWDVIMLDRLEEFATLEQFQASIDGRVDGAAA